MYIYRTDATRPILACYGKKEIKCAKQEGERIEMREKDNRTNMKV